MCAVRLLVCDNNALRSENIHLTGFCMLFTERFMSFRLHDVSAEMLGDQKQCVSKVPTFILNIAFRSITLQHSHIHQVDRHVTTMNNDEQRLLDPYYRR